MAKDQLRGPLEVLLLSVLYSGPAHGYAVIAALRERSDQAVDLPEGTVYPALHRLEREGLVASRWDVGSGRRRRYYELTAAGREALVVRRQEWRTFASGVHAVLGWAR